MLMTKKTNCQDPPVCKGKKIFRQKNTICFENYNLTSLSMLNIDYPRYQIGGKGHQYTLQRVKRWEAGISSFYHVSPTTFDKFVYIKLQVSK